MQYLHPISCHRLSERDGSNLITILANSPGTMLESELVWVADGSDSLLWFHNRLDMAVNFALWSCTNVDHTFGVGFANGLRASKQTIRCVYLPLCSVSLILNCAFRTRHTFTPRAPTLSSSSKLSSTSRRVSLPGVSKNSSASMKAIHLCCS